MRRSSILFLLAALIVLGAGPARGENYTLKGDMDSVLTYELQEEITAGEGIKKLTLSFVVPRSFQSPTYSQDISDFKLIFSPEPQERTSSEDKRGNGVVTATWTTPPPAVNVRLSCNVRSRTTLKVLETKAPFPLTEVDPGLTDYLKATEQVQADDPRIKELARKLTEGVTTEFDAVQRIVSWVVDHVHYVTPPARYDALYSLESGKGNCQNYSHLSAALLRAVGIPVRIVNGVTLSQPYDIEWAKGVLTFKMGQGRHSWIEVWFPDLGWAPFDPQNSVLFVSSRFVRIEVGVDNNETKHDGLLRWAQVRGARQPTLQEQINASFRSDRVKVKGIRESYGPKNLLLVPSVLARFEPVKVAPPPPPPPPPTEEERRELRYEVPFVFGNLDFPEDVDFAFPRTTTASGADVFEMKKNFLVETAEYVTTKVTQYAQVFVLKRPLKLQKVGLALHNFGGDGWLWVDLFEDNGGKPGKPISTSDLVPLETLSVKPGYRWTDFDFRKDSPVLMPGSYWIALGFTGSPVVNWFYTYGKPVGPVYGTRYKGVFQEDWSGALNYEFNYRVVGLTTADGKEKEKKKVVQKSAAKKKRP
ncbi:MAG TPA: transglutaminase domain-containing protein [Syntrophales bacterium]|nr:transglutaminase domain-containing protein [Syntrophales bacterium]HOM06708.1 transglutaminase domain-containing protein [Syntrophales bacterium]HPQ06134.1 transglutaminase domain-containing protein [Syntrophales bacterium]